MYVYAATFGWLCVETFIKCEMLLVGYTQPPSGGCVLKHQSVCYFPSLYQAATFGWLCVETLIVHWSNTAKIAATFGWLCVETTTNKEIASNTARQLPLGSYLLKPDLIKLNSIIFTFLLYLSTQFIPNNISPLYFPLIRSRLCPIFSFHYL